MPDETMRARKLAAFEAPFEAADPRSADGLATTAALRQAHALEYIAYQLGELVRLKKEEAAQHPFG